MKPRKLSKEKRSHLVLVALVTLIAAAGLYYGLVRRQHDYLARLAQQKAEAGTKLKAVTDAIHRADLIKAELEENKAALAAAESDVASGDLYACVYNSLRQFKAPYKVDLPQLSQLGTPVSVNLFPNCPYKQATLTVAGTAHFHDLGRFLADFENQFPHVRVVGLSLDAMAASSTVEPESLAFKLDIVTLVKPNPS